MIDQNMTAINKYPHSMYEKAGEFEKSLMDITSVLELDMFHIKARTRRGRLFEAQVPHNRISPNWQTFVKV